MVRLQQSLYWASALISLTSAYLVAPPGATAPGATSRCSKWVQDSYLLSCGKITNAFGMTKDQFKEWNPSVGETGADCQMIQGLYYCVEVDFHPLTQTSTSTTTTTTSASATEKPPQHSPTQAGMASDCDDFYLVSHGDTCAVVESKYHISAADFLRWNPATAPAFGWAIMSAYTFPEPPPLRSRQPPPPPPPPTGIITTPQPTQPGMVDNCDRFVFVKPGDNCGAVASAAGISLADFTLWNPNAGSTCSGLWANSYACVHLIPSVALTARYGAGCEGDIHSTEEFPPSGAGHCVNTDCKVASLDISAKGTCPDGEVRISYWEQANCQGKWFGYGYASRGQCRTLWSGGWDFKSLYISCATKESDCVSQGTCTIDTLPNSSVC
ncbi:LysM domain protein [Cordyceps fumosorosea ARSEF 2679]|uniref:LysM domain protein n=1 Tax=Cordyceps fumosorosea (strain ARSEF 2679) TaxID=1081104 RepID=A0A168E7Q3_CORFA|nr:LysM domain protein [Cordyceps fumosorosea ARSEF 2679]OAA73471.1 LysM domain protein [Cordyceps fumosorosea ARSEF 2679]